MARLSTALVPTVKDAPSDAESSSHKLLVRAGMVRQLGAGLWTYLPAGWRVHRKIEAIIREEMDRIDGQEMSMPVMQPAGPWEKTGRIGIEELFRLQDRKGSEMVLAMTHEEAVTTHIAAEVRSYRDLPKLLYQIQLKERDEPRPRAGVLRTREFVMKDAYSFDRDEAGLDAVYARCIEAYDRIFDRCSISWYRVESDVGMMGGSGAHEYMAPCPAGEDEIALAPGYAANVEVASAEPREFERPPSSPEPVQTKTPGMKTVEEVAGALGVDPAALIKAVPFVTGSGELLMALVRGDDQVNTVKLAAHLGDSVRPAGEAEIESEIGPPGFIGPVGSTVRVLKDQAITEGGLVCGAGEVDLHLTGVEPGRDFEFEEVDIRRVKEGDLIESGDGIKIEPAIEVGNIFRLGTRYSEALGATFLDEEGTERPIVMGSYGIGPARIMAAAAEQRADDKGLVWPMSIAPWQVHLVSLAKSDEPARELTDRIYGDLSSRGIEVLYDDRDASPGQKLTDAELIGCPLRIVIGRRSVEKGEAEFAWRASGEEGTVPLEGASDAIVEMILEAS
jgi:prolyl-tRNA synthetase